MNICIKINKYRFLRGGVSLKMKDEDKVKDQLIKELQKMHEKVADLEEVKLKYNQVDKKLKQAYKKLVKFIEEENDPKIFENKIIEYIYENL